MNEEIFDVRSKSLKYFVFFGKCFYIISLMNIDRNIIPNSGSYVFMELEVNFSDYHQSDRGLDSPYRPKIYSS